MRQFNKFKNTRGFLSLWERVIRFRYMITEEAKRRTKILAFFEQYGLQPTKDAFGVPKSTLYRWKSTLEKDERGHLECLNNGSRAPKKRRKRVTDPAISDYIVRQRTLHHKLGKKKLVVLISEDMGLTMSESKVGRILGDLKKADRLPKNIKLSLYAKTGRLAENTRKKRKKLRIKDYKPERAGDVVQIDTQGRGSTSSSYVQLAVHVSVWAYIYI